MVKRGYVWCIRLSLCMYVTENGWVSILFSAPLTMAPVGNCILRYLLTPPLFPVLQCTTSKFCAPYAATREQCAPCTHRVARLYTDSRCSWFSQSLHVYAGIIPHFGQGRFLPNPFHFTIAVSSYHSTLCSLRY
jgi:hypothetical protein